MNAKLKIVYESSIASFNSEWIRPITSDYFEFEIFNREKKYPLRTIFYLNPNTDTQWNFKVEELTNRGFKVLIDNLWEVDIGPIDNCFKSICPQWFWYNESLWYRYLKYDTYVPKNDKKYVALMPMNRIRKHRTYLLSRLKNLLPNMMWSYVEKGRQLPYDKTMSWDAQRFFNPIWYDECYITLVVETRVEPSISTPIFITEKTFKPIAFYHPFLIYGNFGVLSKLKFWGFETFENLWNEEYDEQAGSLDRCNSIIKIMESLNIKNYDNETIKKLEYNRNLFFDKNLVTKGIIDKVINPIIEFAESD